MGAWRQPAGTGLPIKGVWAPPAERFAQATVREPRWRSVWSCQGASGGTNLGARPLCGTFETLHRTKEQLFDFIAVF